MSNSLTSLQTSVAELTADATARLRDIYLQLSNAPAHERIDALESELIDMLSAHADDAREAVLDEVTKCFPSPEYTAPAEGAKPANPDELVEQLAQAMASMPDPRRRELLRRLSGPTTESDLRRRLGLAESIPLDPGREAELTSVLVEFVKRLDTFVDGVWNTLTTDRSSQPSATLKSVMAAFVVDDSESGTNRKEVQASLTTLDQRARILMSTIRAFARNHAERFAPSEIESMVNSGFMANKLRASWDKYVQLCGGTGPEHLEAEILTVCSDIVQRMYREGR